MIDRLDRWMATPWYWLTWLVLGLFLEAAALFYQHVLNEPPCVLCIHARLWVLGGIVAASAGLAWRRLWLARLVAQLALVASLVGLLERSWIALLIERGRYDGVCGMDPGFPAWLPLDAWLPNLFEVWTMCGYSPYVFLEVTMVEALTWGAAAALLVAIAGAAIQALRRS